MWWTYDSIATEKIELMRLFGAEVRLQPSVPFRDPRNYYQEAGRLAREIPNSVFSNQVRSRVSWVVGWCCRCWRSIHVLP